jgi:predicted nucleic acid-binding protein
MSTTGYAAVCDRRLATMIPSDALKHLRELGTVIPFMREMGLPAQFRLIVDANVIYSELLWLTGRRKNKNARTILQEVVAAGTVVLIAPRWLDEEVHEHLEEWAAEAGVSANKYLSAWERYRQSIAFVQPKGKGKSGEVDPDDAPYVEAYRQYAAHAVYSSDSHIPQMGAPAVDQQVIVTLRDYSRAASWQYTIECSGILVTAAGWHTLIALLEMLAGVASLARRLPKVIQVSLLACAVGLIAHPRSRAWLTDKAQKVGNCLGTVGADAGRFAVRLGAEAILKAEEADNALSKVEACLVPARSSLRVSVYLLCLKEQRPLTLEEIEDRILATGYQTRAKDFRGYLRRILRESKDFAQIDGAWGCVSLQQTAPDIPTL